MVLILQTLYFRFIFLLQYLTTNCKLFSLIPNLLQTLCYGSNIYWLILKINLYFCQLLCFDTYLLINFKISLLDTHYRNFDAKLLFIITKFWSLLNVSYHLLPPHSYFYIPSLGFLVEEMEYALWLYWGKGVDSHHYFKPLAQFYFCSISSKLLAPYG